MGELDDEVLDARRIEELLDLGVEALPLVQQAIDHFVAESTERVAELRRTCATGDAAAVRELAHRLKGSALNLGAVQVAAIALEIEARAADGDLGSVPTGLDRLEAQWRRAGAAMFALRATTDLSTSKD